MNFGCFTRQNYNVAAAIAIHPLSREIIAMSFAAILDQLPPAKSPLLRRFERLLAPNDDAQFEAMAQEARELTRQNFGRTMRMFAPLYLSNECINNCRYCGFSRDNPILRVTLSVEQVLAEARHLAAPGFSPGAARCR